MKRTSCCAFALALALAVLGACSSQEPKDTTPASTGPSVPALESTETVEPSSNLTENEIKAFIASFPSENVFVTESNGKITVLAFDEDLSADVLSALSTQTTPENWADLTAKWQTDALSINQYAPDQNTVFSVVSDEDSSTIFATFINEKETYNLFSTEEA